MLTTTELASLRVSFVVLLFFTSAPGAGAVVGFFLLDIIKGVRFIE